MTLTSLITKLYMVSFNFYRKVNSPAKYSMIMISLMAYIIKLSKFW